MRKRLFTALRVLFVVAIAVVVFRYYVDPGEMGRLLASASLPLLSLALLLGSFDYVMMALKWNILLRSYGVLVPWHTPIAAYFRSQVFSLFVPSVFGMDAYRAYHLKRRGAPLMPVVSSIFVERFVGMLSSLSIIGLLIPFAFHGVEIRHGWMLAGAGWLGFALICAFLLVSLKYTERLGRSPLVRRLPGKAARLTAEFLKAVGGIRARRRDLFVYFALSNLEKLIYGSAVYVAALCIDLRQVSFLHMISATPLIALLERLPISISAIGVREGLFVALLLPYGISATRAITVGVIIRGVELSRIGVALLFWLLEGELRPAGAELASVEAQMAAAGRT
jgi:uncharacterized protein (TIRG00374 family)